MTDRISRTMPAVLLAGATISLAASQPRTTPALDPTMRAMAAAETFLASLDAAQRAKANPPFNESTRVVWSNLPTGIAMQVGAKERNGVKLGSLTMYRDPTNDYAARAAAR